ncbi:MAG: PadR family transcriptional regulator [Methanobacteriaceae archaeon]|nr:PadR family transcriptional regulator [Methanobacteriaceae archaeon]
MWDAFRNLHREFHERIEEMQRFGGLRIWILHVIDEHGPANGVEIMDGIQAHYEAIERAAPFDRVSCRGPKRRTPRPSPGSVYPMLKKMVEEGLINKLDDGKYELTERGQEIVYKIGGRFGFHKKMDRGELSIRKALTEIEGYISYLEDIKEEKLASHKNLIAELSERLKKMEESLPDK